MLNTFALAELIQLFCNCVWLDVTGLLHSYMQRVEEKTVACCSASNCIYLLY